MSESWYCWHGHALQACPEDTALETFCCPTCGANLRPPKDTERMSRALDITFVANSMIQSTARSDGAAAASNVEPSAGSREEDRPISIDGGSGEQVDAFAQTADYVSQPNKDSKRKQSASVRKSTRSDRSFQKPPKLPGIDVIEQLARGGFGVVYRAFDEKHNREVALKTLQRMGPDDLVRFKQEFRALADIAHPNLASLYELISDSRTWFFTMELLRGVDFLQYVWSEFDSLRPDAGKLRDAEPIQATARLSLRRTNRLYDAMKQLIVGLNQLHRADKLHSDIKPSNVMVTTEGRVVLLDFGLVAEIHRDEQGRLPTVVQGTPYYMSPEQAACQSLTEASDWYAVGVMLYEILTGRLPFRGNPVKAMLRKQYEVPVEPSKRQPGIRPEMNELCMALLEINPAARPSAADILRAVDAKELAESIVEQNTASVTLNAELVGREQQLQTMYRLFEETVRGGTRSVFVQGYSGMGKSVLIRNFLDRLPAGQTPIVLEGRCYEQESVPFKALDSLIDALLAYLVSLPADELAELIPHDTLPLTRLFPVLSQIPDVIEGDRPTIDNADQHELRTRAGVTLRELLVRLGKRCPIVLYIDDLQWGDEDSSDLLADLVRPPDPPRLMLLGSYRRENVDQSPALVSLKEAYRRGPDQPHHLDLAVDPLSEADAERLALNLLGRTDRGTRQIAGRIAHESGGSPFFVWELAQHAGDGAVASGQLDLDEIIWSRVCRLPEQTRQLLEVFAIAGRPMRASEAYDTIDARTAGPGLLAQLRTNHFVRTVEHESDTQVETYHDRIRESVVNHLSQAKVRGHHLKLAMVIEQSGDVTLTDVLSRIRRTPDFAEVSARTSIDHRLSQRVFDLAYFFDAAGKPDRAHLYALVAAEQASAQNAYDVAEQQFEIARRGAESADDATRFRVAEGLGDVLTMSGSYVRANQQFQIARALAREDITLARIDGKRGYVSFKQGEMGESEQHFERALTELGNPPPSKSWARALSLGKESVVQILHTLFPKWLTGRGKLDSDRGRMDLFRARLCDGLAYAYWFRRGPVSVLWTHLRHMNLAERYPPSLELGRAYAVHAVMMTAIPLAERGVTYADRSYEIHGDLGDRLGQGKARSFKAFSLLALGRFREGVETGREATELLENAGDVWEANMARMIASMSMYFLGDLRGAERAVQRAYQIGVETGDHAAIAIALYFWSISSPETLPDGALQHECDRQRDDPLSTAAALQGRGMELLFREDNPVDATVRLQQSLDVAKQRGLRNPCIFCGVTWKATALRMVAQRATAGPIRDQAIGEASRAVAAALKITRKYLTARSTALRERAMISVLKGREREARKYFDASLECAASQDAAYEVAKTELAEAEAGLKFGWLDAKLKRDQAVSKIAEIESAIHGPQTDGPQTDGPQIDGPQIHGPQIDGPER